MLKFIFTKSLRSGGLNRVAPNPSRQGSALLVTLLVISLLLTIVMAFVVLVRQDLRRVVTHQELL